MAAFPTAAGQRVFSALSSPSLDDFGVVHPLLEPTRWLERRAKGAGSHLSPPDAWPCRGSQLGQALMLRNSLDALHSHCSRSGCGMGLSEQGWRAACVRLCRALS